MMRWLTMLLRVGRAMLGTGDYEAYLRHMGHSHPDAAPMSRAAFFRNRQEARYGGKNGGRCC